MFDDTNQNDFIEPLVEGNFSYYLLIFKRLYFSFAQHEIEPLLLIHSEIPFVFKKFIYKKYSGYRRLVCIGRKLNSLTHIHAEPSMFNRI